MVPEIAFKFNIEILIKFLSDNRIHIGKQFSAPFSALLLEENTSRSAKY